jgi:hypothetical protein
MKAASRAACPPDAGFPCRRSRVALRWRRGAGAVSALETGGADPKPRSSTPPSSPDNLNFLNRPRNLPGSSRSKGRASAPSAREMRRPSMNTGISWSGSKSACGAPAARRLPAAGRPCAARQRHPRRSVADIIELTLADHRPAPSGRGSKPAAPPGRHFTGAYPRVTVARASRPARLPRTGSTAVRIGNTVPERAHTLSNQEPRWPLLSRFPPARIPRSR